MKIKVSPFARCHLLDHAHWWDTNRASARVRVEDAYEKALDQLKAFPRVGRAYHPLPGYRVYPLKGTPYFLLYRVDDDRSVIEIADVFTPVTGRPPTV